MKEYNLPDKIEEAQKKYLDGEMSLEIKRYLFHAGASELAQRIVESTTEEQLDLIDDIVYDNMLNRYGKRKHE